MKNFARITPTPPRITLFYKDEHHNLHKNEEVRIKQQTIAFIDQASLLLN